MELRCIHATEHDTVVGNAAAGIVDVRTCNTSYPFGIIGDIQIDPAFTKKSQHQTQPLYVKIVDKAQKDLRAAGCVGALVWSDEEALLKPIGFYPLHTEWWLHIPRPQLTPPKKIPSPFFIQHGEGTRCSSFIMQQMALLYNTSHEGAKRSQEDWQSLLRRQNTFFSVVLHKDQMVGYFLMGEVGQRTHVVHEFFAPSAEILYYGLSSLYPYLINDLHLMGPEHKMKNTVSWAREMFHRSTFFRGNMGLISLFKPQVLLDHWLEINAPTLKKLQLRTHQTTPISLEFYHHADLIHKLELHKDGTFMFDQHIPFLTRRNMPTPDLKPIHFYIYWSDVQVV